jgi:hypothetical protein
MEKKELISGLNEVLSGNGFKRSGTLWSRQCDKFMLVVNMRKSKWSNKYYLEVGAICGRDSSGNYLSGAKYIDLNIAVDKLVHDIGTEILDPALDLDISTIPALKILLEHLKEKFVPCLEKMGTAAGIKELYGTGQLRGAAIDKLAREVLGIG